MQEEKWGKKKGRPGQEVQAHKIRVFFLAPFEGPSTFQMFFMGSLPSGVPGSQSLAAAVLS